MSKPEIRSMQDTHNEMPRSAVMTLHDTRIFAEGMAVRAERDARVFALVGDLGAGKTTFSSFFLRSLGVEGPLTSPTFVIMKTYPLSGRSRSSVCHIDCYRLTGSGELRALGFDAILKNPSTILLIEWADRVRDIIPPDAVWIDFSYGEREGERVIRENLKSET